MRLRKLIDDFTRPVGRHSVDDKNLGRRIAWFLERDYRFEARANEIAFLKAGDDNCHEVHVFAVVARCVMLANHNSFTRCYVIR